PAATQPGHRGRRRGQSLRGAGATAALARGIFRADGAGLSGREPAQVAEMEAEAGEGGIHGEGGWNCGLHDGSCFSEIVSSAMPGDSIKNDADRFGPEPVTITALELAVSASTAASTAYSRRCR